MLSLFRDQSTRSLGRFDQVCLLPGRASPLVVALPVGRGQLLAAVLADVAGMGRSALLPVHLEAHEVSRLSPLLSRGTSVSERIG